MKRKRASPVYAQKGEPGTSVEVIERRNEKVRNLRPIPIDIFIIPKYSGSSSNSQKNIDFAAKKFCVRKDIHHK